MKDKIKADNTRRFKRLKAAYLLSYDTDVPGTEPTVTYTKNISAGGVKFLSREMIPEFSMLKLELLVPPIEHKFRARGKVIRLRRLKKRELYYVAVDFVDMPANEQKLLNDFIEGLSQNPDADLYIDESREIIRRKEPVAVSL